jgi:hypothetical protein
MQSEDEAENGNDSPAPSGPPERLGPPIRLRIGLTNPSSRTQIRERVRTTPDGKSNGPSDRWEVCLVEMGDTELVLDLPRDFCGQGEQLVIEISTEGLPQDHHVRLVGQVLRQRFEAAKGFTDSVSVELKQFDPVAWRKLREALSERQSKLKDLFSRMRGAT